MTKSIALFAITVVLCVTFTLESKAIDITPSSGGGPSPLQLAQEIVDSTSGVTLVAGSVTTTINNPGQGNPSSDLRAMGTFSERCNCGWNAVAKRERRTHRDLRRWHRDRHRSLPVYGLSQ